MAQWVKDPALVSAVAWVAAVAQIWSLAWELLYATGAVKKKEKKKEKKSAAAMKNSYINSIQAFPFLGNGLIELIEAKVVFLSATSGVYN